jgi:AI-2 transport protein TqsA
LGLIAFVLNYIPTVGSVIAVIPPTLFAFCSSRAS